MMGGMEEDIRRPGIKMTVPHAETALEYYSQKLLNRVPPLLRGFQMRVIRLPNAIFGGNTHL